MKIWHVNDDDYWGIIPRDLDWAAAVAAAGEQQGLKTTMHLIGDPTDERSPVAAVVAYPPNYVLPRHSHDSDRLELVIRGSVEVDGQWLGPGDIWSSPANQFYGPHNVGEQGCTTLELMSASGGRRLSFDAGDKSINVDFGDPASLAAAADILQPTFGSNHAPAR
ncbi:cupin domain-containing protein [Mycobacterium palustre]|uniref:cupin domain-containing protein n=1 Tax=Mycobacterium palustre TaxID=153971 RepID=UPI0011545A30|nr:cupin domain-containing protein [Mycobacterium palustre]MCV7101353.1 hypothetical protein [Mycobacterium palustre]